MAARIIFHIDINAFFASAHLIQDPSLENKPIVVSRDVTGSVVTTASYEARAFGISSAMPLSTAKKLCPQLIVVELDFSWYLELSERFISVIKRYSPYVQQASIDECYVDVTEAIKSYERPLDLAVEIQKTVLNELKLPVSIGVAPNKFLAKMGSDMKKPLGISVVRIREVEEILWPLSISDMHGIGKKTVPRLKKLGIKTIGDLAVANFDDLKSVLGVNTQVYIDRANGKDSAEIVEETQAKSIGQSKTFANAIADYSELKEAIIREIDEVVRRLKTADLMGKTVQFSIRTEDYKTAVRSITLDHYIGTRDDILERVMTLYEEFIDDGGVTFISVTLSNLRLKDEVIEQIDLFSVRNELSVDDIIKELNNALKGSAFKKASDLQGETSNENN